jgi:SAM-dependent methyltransferase
LDENKVENSGDHLLWSRYEGLSVTYDKKVPHISALRSAPLRIDRLSAINQATAISYRDKLVVEMLVELGVRSLIDVGCDFGSLLSWARYRDIDAVGIDPDTRARELAKAAGLSVYDGSVQQICETSGGSFGAYSHALSKGPLAISSLGFTHVRWVDEELRFRFLEVLLASADYVVVSLDSRDTSRLLERTGASLVVRLSHRSGRFSRFASVKGQYGYWSLGLSVWDNLVAKLRSHLPRNRVFPERILSYASLVVILESKK